MAAFAANDVFMFEGFRLHRRGGGLFRFNAGDVFVPVAIGSRALDVLEVLVGRSGDVVSRDEIIAAVWPTTIVEDNNLNIQIAALRRVLDNGREHGSCIQTVAGRGYRFVARVTKPEAAAPPAVAAASYAGTRPRLSIVVLPFANLSDDSEQQYFADGITDDVTADLSRIDGSFVISRGTAFTYKGKALDAKQIGRELGVRFVLEGSARRSGKLVRVNAQLIDAETAGHLWAERFDRDIGDLFAVQDEITRRIATALNSSWHGAEAARPFDHPDALDYFFRGRAAGAQAKTRDNHAEAIALYEHALALDPRSVAAKSRLASELAGRVLNNMTDSRDADVARAAELAEQALAAAPRNPSAHFAKGQALRAQGRPAEAILEYETVIAFDRNAAYAISTLGFCKFLAGIRRRDDPAPGGVHPPQSPRSVPRLLLSADRTRPSACNHASTTRSSGLRRRAKPCQRIRTCAPISRRPMPSKARPNAPSRNSSRPAG